MKSSKMKFLMTVKDYTILEHIRSYKRGFTGTTSNRNSNTTYGNMERRPCNAYISKMNTAESFNL